MPDLERAMMARPAPSPQPFHDHRKARPRRHPRRPHDTNPLRTLVACPFGPQPLHSGLLFAARLS